MAADRPSVLIAFTSRHGHTATIADRLAHRLRHAGLAESRARLDHGDRPSVPDHDAAIVVASVHAHRHAPDVVHWARANAPALGRMPSALLSVSLTAADEDPEARAATREVIDELLDETGWSPTEALAVAGALQFSHYDLPTRTLMRLVAARHGGATAIDEDVELTDWEALDAFSDRFAARVAAASRPAAGRSPG